MPQPAQHIFQQEKDGRVVVHQNDVLRSLSRDSRRIRLLRLSGRYLDLYGRSLADFRPDIHRSVQQFDESFDHKHTETRTFRIMTIFHTPGKRFVKFRKKLGRNPRPRIGNAELQHPRTVSCRKPNAALRRVLYRIRKQIHDNLSDFQRVGNEPHFIAYPYVVLQMQIFAQSQRLEHIGRFEEQLTDIERFHNSLQGSLLQSGILQQIFEQSENMPVRIAHRGYLLRRQLAVGIADVQIPENGVHRSLYVVRHGEQQPMPALYGFLRKQIRLLQLLPYSHASIDIQYDKHNKGHDCDQCQGAAHDGEGTVAPYQILVLLDFVHTGMHHIVLQVEKNGRYPGRNGLVGRQQRDDIPFDGSHLPFVIPAHLFGRSANIDHDRRRNLGRIHRDGRIYHHGLRTFRPGGEYIGQPPEKASFRRG